MGAQVKKINRSERLKERRRKARIKSGLIVVMAIVVIFFLPFLFFRLDYFIVEEVSVEGALTVSDIEIKDYVEEVLTKKAFGLYPYSNIFIFPSKKTGTEIKKDFPKLLSIQLQRKLFNSINILVTERKAFGIWCQREEDLCFFVDEMGFSFEDAPNYSSKIFLEFVSEKDNLPQIGKNVAPQELFRDTAVVLKYLEDSLLSVQSVSFEESLDVTYYLRERGKIITGRDNIEKIIINLDSILKDDSLGLLSDKGLTVDYLDLRFGNKIFYKSTDD